jgi:hypothetical protein
MSWHAIILSLAKEAMAKRHTLPPTGTATVTNLQFIAFNATKNLLNLFS